MPLLGSEPGRSRTLKRQPRQSPLWRLAIATSTLRPATRTRRASARGCGPRTFAGLGVPDHQDASGQRRSGTADPGGEPDQAGRGLRGPVARALAAESAGHPEAWKEFLRAREDGLARSIGVSNYSLDQIDQLTQVTGVTPAVNQIRWGTSNLRPRSGDRAGTARSGARGLQPVQGQQPRRPDARLHRLKPRRHYSSDRHRLACGPWLRRHPQVGPSRADRGERRRRQDRTGRRGATAIDALSASER